MSVNIERILSANADPSKDPTLIGVFLITALAAGVIIKVAIKHVSWIRVPYTVLLLIFGGVLGALDLNGFSLGKLSHSMSVWINLDPVILLVMFLPPLLFGDSYVVEWHVFRRLSVQALILAVPGVLLSTVLTACVAVYLFPYNWDWTSGLLFGSMFSATDPVAVVALLNELGAPETLSVLIEGESLLNDGVAFVLFIVFERQMSGAEVYTVGEIVGNVVFSSFMGVVIGLIGGMISLYFIQFIWSDPVLETVVTIVAAFGVFFAGEFLHVSGVLAVVTLGLMFAAQAISYISVEVATVMHEFWHIMEYIANTLVFTFSGVVVAKKLFGGVVDDADNIGDDVETNFEAYDFLMLFTLYIFLHLIRVAMLGVLAWPLSKTGYGFNFKSAAVVAWSGLRGAVGLVAALIISREPDCIILPGETTSTNTPCVKRETKDYMMFFMSGIVLMTLLINGTTTKFLVEKLKLNKLSAASRLVFENAALRMHNHTHTAIESLKRQPNYKGANWDTVWSHMPVLSEGVLQQRTTSEHRSFHRADVATLRRNINRLNRQRYESRECLSDVLVAEARHRFLNLVKSSYRHQFKAGACSSWPALQILIEAAARAQDVDNEPLNEWRDSLSHLCYIPNWYRDCWPTFLVRHNIRSLFITRHISRGYDIATSFIEAHSSVEDEFQNIANHEIANQILRESRHMVKQASLFLRDVESSFDEIAQHVKTSIAVQRLLKDSASFAHDMLVNAEIDEKDFATIEHHIEKSLKSIHRRSGFLKIQTAEDIFRRAHFFEGVSKDFIDNCYRHSTKRFFNRGDKLIERGDVKNSVFLIIRGKVKVLMKMQHLRDYPKNHQRETSGGYFTHSNKKKKKSDGKKDQQNGAYSPSGSPKNSRARFWSHGSQDSVVSQFSAVSAPSTLEHEGGLLDGDSTSVDTSNGMDDSNSEVTSLGTRKSPSHSEPTAPASDLIYDLGLARKDSMPKDNKVIRLVAGPSPMVGPLTIDTQSGMVNGIGSNDLASATSINIDRVDSKSKKLWNGISMKLNSKSKATPVVHTLPAEQESHDRQSRDAMDMDGNKRSIKMPVKMRRASSAIMLSDEFAGVQEQSNGESNQQRSLIRPQSLHAFALNLDSTDDVDEEQTMDQHGILHNMLHPFAHDHDDDFRNAQQVSGEHHETTESVWSRLSRGDTVGEMELIADMPVVATVVAESMVEAYEIKFDFLYHLFRDNPNSKLERNLLQQAGLLAMESHYPQLRNAPYSLLKWLLHHIEIIHPKSGIPEIMGEGKGIILRGKLLKAANRDLGDPLVPITVFDIPKKPLTFSDGSVVLWVPKTACLLAEQSHSHNFRDANNLRHTHARIAHGVHGHHPHHAHHHGRHVMHNGHHLHLDTSHRLSQLQANIARDGSMLAVTESMSSLHLPPLAERAGESPLRKKSAATEDEGDDSDLSDDEDVYALQELEMADLKRGLSPRRSAGRSMNQVRESLDEVCISNSFVLDRIRNETETEEEDTTIGFGLDAPDVSITMDSGNQRSINFASADDIIE